MWAGGLTHHPSCGSCASFSSDAGPYNWDGEGGLLAGQDRAEQARPGSRKEPQLPQEGLSFLWWTWQIFSSSPACLFRVHLPCHSPQERWVVRLLPQSSLPSSAVGSEFSLSAAVPMEESRNQEALVPTTACPGEPVTWPLWPLVL